MSNLKPRRRFSLALAAVLLIVSSIAAARRARGAEELPPQQRTIHDLRNVGTAMFQWYQEERAPKQTAAGRAAARKDKKSTPAAAPAPTTVDLTQIPQISHDDLVRLLVPKYIAAIPEKDGWGNPYEFRLNTQDPDARRIMAVRSPGADGTFSGTTYHIGAFPAAEQGQDLVWTDGYFTRWPDK